MMTRLAQFCLASVAVLALVSGALAAEFVPLGFFPGGSSFSKGRSVSPDRSVVVGESGGPSGIEAFRWSALDGLVALGDLPGGQFYSTASAVSADGNVIAGASRSASSGAFDEAFRWTSAGGMVGLGTLPGAFSPSRAILKQKGLTIQRTS